MSKFRERATDIPFREGGNKYYFSVLLFSLGDS